MAHRTIRVFGDPVLKTVSDPVTVFDDRVRRLVRDLLDSVDEPGRAGVAAPQIGVNLRAFSYNVDGKIGYLINPEVVELSGEPVDVDEGCLSVPELWFPTPRAPRAVVRGVDQDNEPVTLSGEGLMAQCLQHETDHLDGLLYIDRLPKDRRREAMRRIRESSWFALA